MNIIKILEQGRHQFNKTNWYSLMTIQKYLVEQSFDWINLSIDFKYKRLIGDGMVVVDGKEYEVNLVYSVFNGLVYDKIYIKDKRIKFNKSIHLYHDLSLCLYHPLLDQSYSNKISLVKLIPWISEWIVFYELWKVYGVWLADEHKH